MRTTYLVPTVLLLVVVAPLAHGQDRKPPAAPKLPSPVGRWFNATQNPEGVTWTQRCIEISANGNLRMGSRREIKTSTQASLYTSAGRYVESDRIYVKTGYWTDWSLTEGTALYAVTTNTVVPVTPSLATAELPTPATTTSGSQRHSGTLQGTLTVYANGQQRQSMEITWLNVDKFIMTQDGVDYTYYRAKQGGFNLH